MLISRVYTPVLARVTRATVVSTQPAAVNSASVFVLTSSLRLRIASVTTSTRAPLFEKSSDRGFHADFGDDAVDDVSLSS